MEQILSIRTDTKRYTKEDILAEIIEDTKILAEFGYKECLTYHYSVKFSRAKKTLGYCCRVGKGQYEIAISESYVRTSEPKHIHNTIMHEVMHSINGGDNHTGEWKKCATKLNNACRRGIYQFTEIRRLASAEKMETVPPIDYKYSITCDKCNVTSKYIRKTKIVQMAMNKKYPLLTCKHCGGHNFSVKTL